MKKTKGITLIALVVTIVVLLILVGVSINLVFNSDGLFSKTNEAASKYNQSKEEELAFLQGVEEYFDKYNGAGSATTTPTENYEISLNLNKWVVTGGKSYIEDVTLVATTNAPKIIWSSNNPNIATVDQNGIVKAGTQGGDTIISATIEGTDKKAECTITTELFSEIKGDNFSYTDKNNNTATVPKGFAIGISDNVNKISNGLVIQDNLGNQFVWIPCYVTGGINTSTTYATEYKRTDFGVYNGDVSFSDFTETLDTNDSNSIKNYGGFYIGRYEAGADNEVYNNDITRKTLIKRNKYPYNNVTLDNSKTKSNNFASDNNYDTDKVYTKLVSSYAWDTALCFIQKTVTNYAINSPQGYYMDTIPGGNVLTRQPFNTGLTTSACNIYDMGGNLCEFISERYTTTNNVQLRGGNFVMYSYENPAGERSSSITRSEDYGTAGGFRPTLFLK